MIMRKRIFVCKWISTIFSNLENMINHLCGLKNVLNPESFNIFLIIQYKKLVYSFKNLLNIISYNFYNDT